MGDILSGLESMGLGKLKGIDLYEDEKQTDKKDDEKNKKEHVINEADVLFDKTYTCPVCDTNFKNKTIRTGKIKLASADADLRPVYQGVDCLKYDVVACPSCGYAALSKFFDSMTSPQARLVQEMITKSFRGLPAESETYSYDDALARYKLALVNSIVKKARVSERAYTCLKSAWILRGKAENLPEDTPDYDTVKENLAAEEMDFISNAYTGFSDAFSKEGFPICGMDEPTLTYLMAELARRLGNYDESSRWVSRVLTSRSANERLKSRAREIKEKLTEQKKL